MHLCGKFVKRNNNYKVVEKGNKLVLIKPCQTANIERSQNSTKLDRYVCLDPCICVIKFTKRNNNYKLVEKGN